MLHTTKIIKDRTDMEYQEFIRICNEVLPLKIETPYINLANYIEEYLKSLRIMNYNDQDALRNGITIGTISNNLNNNIEAEYNISKRLKEISQKGSHSLEDYEELIKLAQIGKQLVITMNGQKNNIDIRQRDTIEKNVSSSESQNGVPTIIASMKDALKSISELDLEDNKRLDNLEITSKHINQIANLNIGGKNKEYALDLLKEFLKTRKNAFRVVEEFAIHILEKYKKRETDFSEDLSERYILSSMALEALELGDDTFTKGNFIFNDFSIVNGNNS